VPLEEADEVLDGGRASHALQESSESSNDARGEVGGHYVRSLGDGDLGAHARPAHLVDLVNGWDETELERRRVIVVGDVFEQLLVQVEAAVRALEWSRLVLAVDALPCPGLATAAWHCRNGRRSALPTWSP